MPKSDHEKIWLEPGPVWDEDLGRMWCPDNAWDDGTEYVRADISQELIDALTEALERQTDNMAFFVNNMSMPDQYYAKFSADLEIDRAVLNRVKERK